MENFLELACNSYFHWIGKSKIVIADDKAGCLEMAKDCFSQIVGALGMVSAIYGNQPESPYWQALKICQPVFNSVHIDLK